MKLFSILAACGMGILVSSGQNEGLPTQDAKKTHMREIVSALGAESYLERGQAMKDLWEMADASLPALKDLIEGDDPELQARARELQRQILSGILPGTPPKIAVILKKFNDATGDQRLNVFSELFREKAYDYLFRLMKIEEDPSLLEQMKNRMERYLPTIVRAQLVAGKWEDARRYLEQWHSPANDRNLAALLRTRGLFEDELQRLSQSQKPEDRARYLAFLQVQGDPQAVYDEAVAQNNTGLRNSAAILLGNPVPALQSGLDIPNINQRRYLQLVLARFENDEKSAADLRDDLLKSARSNDELRKQALSVFYRLGDLAQIEFLMQDDKEAQETYYFAMEKPLLALAAAGIKDGKVDDAWLSKQCEKMLKDVMENGEETTSFKLKLLAGFYENHGDIETSAKIVTAYAKAFQGEDQSDYLAAYTADFMLYSPRAFCLAIDQLYKAENAEEGQRALGLIFGNHREESELFSWLYQTIQTLNPDFSLAQLTGMTLSCATETCYVNITKRDELLAKIEKAATDNARKGDFEDLQKLMRMAILRSDSEGLLRIGTLLKNDKESNWSYALTLNHAYWGRWKEAETEWADYLKKGQNYENWPPYLYLAALLLENADQEKEAKKKMDRATLLGLSDRDYQNAILSYLSNFSNDTDAQYAQLKYCFLLQSEDLEGTHPHLAFLFQEAIKQRDWPVAEAAGEVLLAHSGTDVSELTALQIRYGTDMARGFRLLNEGQTAEAEKTLEATHDLLPGSGLHADDLLPELRARGLLSLHDRLFEKSYLSVMAVLKNFPNSDNDKNTAAWLASRALLKLDEAELLMADVLKTSPRNAAYLDTMAEIQFAKGDREKALEWSLKSLEIEASDRALRGQYQRYQNAPLPSR